MTVRNFLRRLKRRGFKLGHRAKGFLKPFKKDQDLLGLLSTSVALLDDPTWCELGVVRSFIRELGLGQETDRFLIVTI